MVHPIGLILEGGEMPSMYTAGVLDFLMDAGIWLAHCYATSTNAVTAANYLSKQRGRTLRITTAFQNDKRYCSTESLLSTGNLLNADFLYKQIPNHLDPFDYHAFEQSETRLTTVVTNVETGKPEYKQLTNLKQQMQWLRAASSPPLLSGIVELESGKYLDGSITDSIPLAKALADGYPKSIVILTQHDGYQKQPNTLTELLTHALYKNYPQLLIATKRRHLMYHDQLALVAKQERLGNLLILRPKASTTIKEPETDPKKLIDRYEQGYADAKEQEPQIHAFLMAKQQASGDPCN